MNQLKINILLATAAIAPSAALIVAWLGDRWLPSSWLMRISVITIVMVVAGVCASLIMARLARSQIVAQRYLSRLCAMDDNDLIHNLGKYEVELGMGSPWKRVFQELRNRLLRHGEQISNTEINRAATEIRVRRSAAAQQRVTAILAGLDEPVLAIDEYNDLVLANSSAESLFDFHLQSGEKRALADLVRCEELLTLLDNTQSRKAAVQKTREIEIVNSAGKSRWYSVTARTMEATNEHAGESSSAKGAVAVLRDISDQKEIQKRNAEFVSSVSHEMKTPLAGIKAYVELLADGDAEDDATREEFLGVINGQADRLQRLIDNLLNLSRIEAGVVKVSKQSQPLNDLLQEAYNVVQPGAQQKNIDLTLDLSPLYLGVLVDRDMLLQAAINLLSNAIKYTPAGGRVTLRSRLRGADVQFEVEDQGVGLSPEDQQRVFEKFYRVKKDQNMAPGTGLGLPLAKHIVEDVHGGQLTVESQLGVGSKFCVQLPGAGQMG